MTEIAPKRSLRGRISAFFSPAVYTTDDRGATVWVDPAPEHAVFDEDGEEVPASTSRPAAKSETSREKTAIARARTTFVGWLTIAGVLAVLGGLLWVGWMFSSRLARAAGLPGYLGPPIGIGLLTVWSLFHRATLDKYARQERVRLELGNYLPRGLCGACGYALDSLPEAPDACTECPECGAAWKLGLWKEDFPEYREPPGARPRLKRRRPDPYRVSDFRGVQVRLLCEQPVDEFAAELRRRRPPLVGSWLPGDTTRLFICIPGLVALVLVYAAAWPRALVFMVLAVEAAIAVFAVAWHWGATRTAALALMANEMVLAGHCPCCRAVLGERPALADGARVCPACGAAWKAT